MIFFIDTIDSYVMPFLQARVIFFKKIFFKCGRLSAHGGITYIPYIILTNPFCGKSDILIYFAVISHR